MTTAQDQQSRAVIAAWNAQADEHNQWETLGDDEKIDWAMQAARALPAGMEPAYRVKVRGVFQDPAPLAAAFGLPDGTHDLYTAAQVLAMGRVPPDWQAVPVEPSIGMLRALVASFGQEGRLFATKWAVGTFDADYRAMLAAAPRPPAAQEGA